MCQNLTHLIFASQHSGKQSISMNFRTKVKYLHEITCRLPKLGLVPFLCTLADSSRGVAELRACSFLHKLFLSLSDSCLYRMYFSTSAKQGLHTYARSSPCATDTEQARSSSIHFRTCSDDADTNNLRAVDDTHFSQTRQLSLLFSR